MTSFAESLVTTILGPDMFLRDSEITIGDRVIRTRPDDLSTAVRPTLRIEFVIERNTNRSLNTADITIYNLSKTSRDELDENDTLRIKAGHVGTSKLLFIGTISDLEHQRQGVDWVTKLQGTDGGAKVRSARINTSFQPGTPVTTVILSVASATGHSLGNLPVKLQTTVFRGRESIYRQGYVASGRADREFDKLMKFIGLKYSIQDGAIQVLDPREPAGIEVISLNASSGLIGVPEIGKDGQLKAVSLLQGDLAPGRLVSLISDEVTGSFRIERVTHQGNTFGDEWYSTIEARPL